MGPRTAASFPVLGGPFLCRHICFQSNIKLSLLLPLYQASILEIVLTFSNGNLKKQYFSLKYLLKNIYLMKYFNKIFLKVNFPNYRFLIPRLPTDSTEELFFIQVSYPYFFHPSFLSLYTFKAIFDNELLK